MANMIQINPVNYKSDLSYSFVAVLNNLNIKTYKELEKSHILATTNKVIDPMIMVHMIASVHKGKIRANMTAQNIVKNKTPKCKGTVAARSLIN
jgi:predicted RNA methylase